VVEIDQLVFVGDDFTAVRTRVLAGFEFANRLQMGRAASGARLCSVIIGPASISASRRSDVPSDRSTRPAGDGA